MTTDDSGYLCGEPGGPDDSGYLAYCILRYGHVGQHKFDVPSIFSRIADRVLAHKPKPKSKPARKRARRAKKIAQAADV